MHEFVQYRAGLGKKLRAAIIGVFSFFLVFLFFFIQQYTKIEMLNL
jgi:hypothetical protein